MQAVVVTEDRRAAAGELFDRFGVRLDMSPDEVLQTPFVLIGTTEVMADQPRARRECFEFSIITVREPDQGAYAPVIARLRSN